MTDTDPTEKRANLDGERRDSFKDRRTKPRQGKLERRRNRCGGCQFYGESPQPNLLPPIAQCQHHHTTVGQTDFACLKFKPI